MKLSCVLRVWRWSSFLFGSGHFTILGLQTARPLIFFQVRIFAMQIFVVLVCVTSVTKFECNEIRTVMAWFADVWSFIRCRWWNTSCVKSTLFFSLLRRLKRCKKTARARLTEQQRQKDQKGNLWLVRIQSQDRRQKNKAMFKTESLSRENLNSKPCLSVSQCLRTVHNWGNV